MDEKDKTILVVDDNITTRTLLQKILEKAGYGVLTAGDGSTALRLLSQNRVDLITLDAEMPVMDGFSACEKIRENPKTANLPVIMITSYNSAREIQKGFKAGVSEYLVKPVSQKELLPLVSAFFSKETLSTIGKVAIISSEQSIRTIVDYAVRQNNLDAIFFDSPEVLIESEDEFELIIIDVPAAGAYLNQTIQKLRQERKNVPIVILSSDSSSEVVVEAYIQGVADYIIKPFEAKVLSAKILSLFRSGRYHIVQEENRINTSRIKLLSELYVTLAHHINNVLCSLSLRVEHLLTKALKEEQKSILMDMKEDVKKIESIIEKLKDVSKHDDIPLETYLDDINMIKL